MQKLVLFLIRLYHSLPLPDFHYACRFVPTCSHYAYESITKYGILKGSFLGIKRFLRCHPWQSGGLDQVP